MTEYQAQTGQGKYNLQLETTNKDCYLEVQNVVRKYIDWHNKDHLEKLGYEKIEDSVCNIIYTNKAKNSEIIIDAKTYSVCCTCYDNELIPQDLTREEIKALNEVMEELEQ